jgi:small-conductance mechanosensitive channel
VGIDRLAERAGISSLLAEAGFDRSVGSLIARVVYWIVLLVFLIAATESLGLPGVVETLRSLVAYLPSVLGAALIILLGSLIAGVVGDTLGTLTKQTGVEAAPLLGQIVRYVIIAFSIILALDQLGIETTLLIVTAIAIVAATALALALAFGIGSRELARNIMAGFHVKETFSIGVRLKVKGHTGHLVNVGSVKATLETENGLVSLPNTVLIDEDVTLMPEVEATS